MAKQMRTGWQTVTIVLINFALHLVSVEFLPMTRVYLYGKWLMSLLAGVILLAVFFYAAVCYRIKPMLWLLGIPISSLLCAWLYHEGLYGASNRMESYRYGLVPVYLYCVLIPIAECGIAFWIRHMQRRLCRQSTEEHKKTRVLKQILCIVAVYLISLFLWNQGALVLFWRLADSIWLVKSLIACVSLMLFLLAIVRYDIRPLLWLIGIPVLLLGKYMFCPGDFMAMFQGAWQQLLPVEGYCILVPIVYCVFGFLQQQIREHRWRK